MTQQGEQNKDNLTSNKRRLIKSLTISMTKDFNRKIGRPSQADQQKTARTYRHNRQTNRKTDSTGIHD